MGTLFHSLLKRRQGSTQRTVQGAVPTGGGGSTIYGGTLPAQNRPPTYAPATQGSIIADPMNPAPIPASFGAISSFTNATWYSAIALAATTTPGQPCPLRNLGSIKTLQLGCTETLTTTGTQTTGTLFASIFDHFVIQSPEGDTLINCPGGAMMELLEIFGNYPPGVLAQNNTLLAAQATAQSATLVVPGLRLPQKQNSYNFIPTFNTIVGSGSVTATANTVSVNVSGEYGLTGPLETHFISQTYTVNATGYTDLGVTSIAKNQIIGAMFVTGATTANIDEFYVENNGGVIEGISAGNAGAILVQRQSSRFSSGSSIPSGDLIYTPPSKWVANDSSYVRVHNTGAAQTWTVGWYWLQVPKQYGA